MIEHTAGQDILMAKTRWSSIKMSMRGDKCLVLIREQQRYLCYRTLVSAITCDDSYEPILPWVDVDDAPQRPLGGCLLVESLHHQLAYCETDDATLHICR